MMESPFFILWLWSQPGFRTAFTAEHVNLAYDQLLRAGVPENKVIAICENPHGVKCKTHPLWPDHSTVNNASGAHLPSCYRRLKLFDPSTQTDIGIPQGARVVSIDLDMVIVSPSRFLELFNRDERFVGWQVPGTRHALVLNGSMWLFTANADLAWVWHRFDPVKSPREAIARGFMGSDQGYLSCNLLGKSYSGGWTAHEHGVLSYTRNVKQARLLPKHGRVVFFPGKSKPWERSTRRESPWIERYLMADGAIAPPVPPPPPVRESIDYIRQWQKNILMRRHGPDGHVLSENLALSRHLDAVLSVVPNE